jgi:hypothetical protein
MLGQTLDTTSCIARNAPLWSCSDVGALASAGALFAVALSCMSDLLQSILGGFLGGGLAGAIVSYFNNRREIGAKMIGLAVKVLSEDPADQPALRDWAAKLLAYYSPIKLDEEAQRELRDKFLVVEAQGEARGSSRAMGRPD